MLALLGPAHGPARWPLPRNTASASQLPPSSAMHPGASATYSPSRQQAALAAQRAARRVPTNAPAPP
eukprot:4270825-Prymnesium_polylepis.1